MGGLGVWKVRGKIIRVDWAEFRRIWSRETLKSRFFMIFGFLESHFITEWAQILLFCPRPQEHKLLFLILTFSNNDSKQTKKRKKNDSKKARVSSSGCLRRFFVFKKRPHFFYNEQKLGSRRPGASGGFLFSKNDPPFFEMPKHLFF